MLNAQQEVLTVNIVTKVVTLLAPIVTANDMPNDAMSNLITCALGMHMDMQAVSSLTAGVPARWQCHAQF